jgi:CheY-like chemotaxis protein
MPFAGQRILCVDRDQDSCHMLKAVLGLVGYEVYSVGSVAAALRLAKSQHFDCFLLEYAFPDGTGVEFCQQIRASGSEIPVIFCSGYRRKADRQQAIEAGAQAYFVKPVDIGVLRHTLIGLGVRGKP